MKNEFTIVDGVAYIQLTQGQVALVDEADLPLIAEHKWYASRDGRSFYVRTNAPTPDGKRTSLLLHRLLLPDVAEIDHQDGDGLNNRRQNLRAATKQQNGANSRKTTAMNGLLCSSDYKGVSWDNRDQKWRAQIMVNGKHHGLGYFTDERDAARAYDTAALKLYGEFAHLNFQCRPWP